MRTHAAIVSVVAAALAVGGVMYVSRSTHDHVATASMPASPPGAGNAVEFGSPGSPSASAAQHQAIAAGTRIAERFSPVQAHAAAQNLVACAAAEDAEPRPDLDPALARFHRDSLTSSLNCTDLNRDFSVYELAEFAAQAGDPDAQLDFPALAAYAFVNDAAALNPDLVAEYKRDSLQFLQMAAKNGKLDALQHLAESYESGRFTEQDPVLAYAYAHAYARRFNSALAHRRASQLSEHLKPEQIAEAERLANRL